MLASLWRLRALGVATILCACTNPEPPPAPPAQPAVSYDGRYVGSIHLVSSALVQGWCDTPPSLTLMVNGNAFSYTLPHPNLPHEPFYNPNFAVHVAPDGSFRGPGGDLDYATMTGRITGSHLTGRIDGADCSYEFTADRR
jgi:hypothetical protein